MTIENGALMSRNQRCVDQIYSALSAADKASDATGFVEYMMKALHSAMQEVVLAQPGLLEMAALSRHQVGTKLALSWH